MSKQKSMFLVAGVGAAGAVVFSLLNLISTNPRLMIGWGIGIGLWAVFMILGLVLK